VNCKYERCFGLLHNSQLRILWFSTPEGGWAVVKAGCGIGLATAQALQPELVVTPCRGHLPSGLSQLLLRGAKRECRCLSEPNEVLFGKAEDPQLYGCFATAHKTQALGRRLGNVD